MGRKIRLVKCPKCLKILQEDEDVPRYQCGGCSAILQVESQMGQKIRFVKCPKCLKILQEDEDVPLYQCGGCSAILEAKRRNTPPSAGETERTQVNELQSEPATNNVSISSGQDTVLPSSQEQEYEKGRDASMEFLFFSPFFYSGDGGGDIGKILDIPKVLEYIPAERTKITIDKDSDFPAGEYGAKPERFCSSDAKTNANLLDSGDGRGAIDRNVVDVQKVLEYIHAERTDNAIDNSVTSGAKPVRSYSDPTTNADLLDSKIIPPQIQVFINFRGVQLRNNFIGYLVHSLRKREVNVFIDNHERRGEDLNTLFKRIEESGIAIAVFSSMYAESKWCLDELVKIKERVHQGLLKVIPIFYKVNPTDVKRLKGEFGDHFRDKEHRYGSDSPLIKAWKEAIVFVTHKHALVYDERSGALEIDFVETIVKEVLEMLQSISTGESSQSSN